MLVPKLCSLAACKHPVKSCTSEHILSQRFIFWTFSANFCITKRLTRAQEIPSTELSLGALLRRAPGDVAPMPQPGTRLRVSYRGLAVLPVRGVVGFGVRVR